PLCQACTGRTILAHLPPSEAQRILSEECAPIGAVPGAPRPEGTRHPAAGSPDHDGWVGERLYDLQMVRAAGYATGLNEPWPGMAGVSAPVFGRGAEILGALTVSGPTVRFRRREMLAAAEQLRAAAATLSSQLGHRVPVALLPRRGLERRVSGRMPTP